MLAHCSCCYRGNRQFKRIKKGRKSLNRHLDIVKLIRTTTDVSIIKKLLLSPRQRAIMKRQRRYAFKLESDDFADSSSSGNELINYGDTKLFRHRNFS